jgi:hypothetical protein
MKTKIYSIENVTLDILKSNPLQLSVSALGTANSTGWIDAQLLPRFGNLHKPTNGIYEFDFVATPPTGYALQVLTPIWANYIFSKIPKDIKKVIIYGKKDSKEVYYPSKKESGLKAATDLSEPRTAIGYSIKFSFDEAFQNAIHSLPPNPMNYPDYLETVKVIEIGALFGGIAGVRQMFIKVEAK